MVPHSSLPPVRRSGNFAQAALEILNAVNLSYRPTRLTRLETRQNDEGYGHRQGWSVGWRAEVVGVVGFAASEIQTAAPSGTAEQPTSRARGRTPTITAKRNANSSS